MLFHYINILLLLLLRWFSRVRLCATPKTAAHQAPPTLGFSRQEHWGDCHFLLQCMKVKSENEVTQSCLTLSDPMDCGPPGSSVHGIFQTGILDWAPISFCRDLFRCRDHTHVFWVSCIGRQILYHWATSLLKGEIWTQRDPSQIHSIATSQRHP